MLTSLLHSLLYAGVGIVIAKYAEIEGLPIKTALGLVTKESTLGNPTDDKSVYKLMGKDKALFFKRGSGSQFINNKGQDVWARALVNYYKDSWNPYEEAIKTAKKKAMVNSAFVKPNDWGDPNNPYYKKNVFYVINKVKGRYSF